MEMRSLHNDQTPLLRGSRQPESCGCSRRTKFLIAKALAVVTAISSLGLYIAASMLSQSDNDYWKTMSIKLLFGGMGTTAIAAGFYLYAGFYRESGSISSCH